MDPSFGGILDQDTDNLILQQGGLEASAKPGITLGNFQEVRIRHFQKAIDKYMAMEPKIPDWKKLQRRPENEPLGEATPVGDVLGYPRAKANKESRR